MWKISRLLMALILEDWALVNGLTTTVGWLLLLLLIVLSRPQSVCNQSFWWRFCVVVLLSGFFSVGVGAFVICMSQISSFFSSNITDNVKIMPTWTVWSAFSRNFCTAKITTFTVGQNVRTSLVVLIRKKIWSVTLIFYRINLKTTWYGYAYPKHENKHV